MDSRDLTLSRTDVTDKCKTSMMIPGYLWGEPDLAGTAVDFKTFGIVNIMTNDEQ